MLAYTKVRSRSSTIPRTGKSAQEVQQFLGLANYYRRFISDFATIAKPLHQLTECQEAFDHLRRRLTTAPVLAFPDYSKPFILDTDASDTGIGAVLSQLDDDGRECVIAYGSRLLTKAERRYCVTCRELLAVVVFTSHFRPHLLNRHFKLRTDHGSLTWLCNFKDPEGQLARWLEKLQEFDFKIVHRGGKKHCNADALSRIPCVQCGREPPTEETSLIIEAVDTQLEDSVTPSMLQYDPENVQSLQREDPTLMLVIKAMESNQTPTPAEIKSQSPGARRLIQMKDQLVIHTGVLYRRYIALGAEKEHLQLVVPNSLRKEILAELHWGAVGDTLEKKNHWHA